MMLAKNVCSEEKAYYMLSSILAVHISAIVLWSFNNTVLHGIYNEEFFCVFVSFETTLCVRIFLKYVVAKQNKHSVYDFMFCLIAVRIKVATSNTIHTI